VGTISSFWMACLCFGIVGLGATGMWTPILTVVQRWFVPAHWVCGILRDSRGGYDEAFMFSIGIALVGLLLFFPVKTRPEKIP